MRVVFEIFFGVQSARAFFLTTNSIDLLSIPIMRLSCLVNVMLFPRIL